MNGVIKLEDLVNMSESVHDDGIPAEVLMGSPRSTQTRKIPQRKTEDDGLRKTRKSRLKESVDVPALLEKLAKEEHCGSENPGKRKSYDIEFKLTAVEYAEKHSKKKAADHFKVDRRQIQLWCQKKELLQQQLNATEDGVVKKRLAGAGRTVHDWSLDYQLMGWMNNMRDEGVALSRSCIQEKAKELALNKDFKASNGWLERFLKRHSQSLLRPVNSNLEILAKSEDEMTD